MGRSSAIARIIMNVVPFGLALAITFLIPVVSRAPMAWAIAAIIIGAMGFASFVYAKFSALRKGHLLSWGPSAMSIDHRKYYWAGYALMAISVVLMLTASVVVGTS
jgi:hypothetical protein